jgi:hypothetical protein
MRLMSCHSPGIGCPAGGAIMAATNSSLAHVGFTTNLSPAPEAGIRRPLNTVSVAGHTTYLEMDVSASRFIPPSRYRCENIAGRAKTTLWRSSPDRASEGCAPVGRSPPARGGPAREASVSSVSCNHPCPVKSQKPDICASIPSPTAMLNVQEGLSLPLRAAGIESAPAACDCSKMRRYRGTAWQSTSRMAPPNFAVLPWRISEGGTRQIMLLTSRETRR